MKERFNLKNLITINKKFINCILIYLFLCGIILFLISQIKIEKSFEALMSIDEDKEIVIIINSSDTYFLKEQKTINFILDNKLYIVDDISLTALPGNKFSLKINDKYLKSILQIDTTLKININLGHQKLYELFFQD